MAKRTRKNSRIKKVGSAEAEISMYATEFWQDQAERSGLSKLYMTLGGLAQSGSESDPMLLADRVANSIQASLETTNRRAEPPPSDIMAMMRLVEYFCRVDGDVYNSVSIPGDVMLKDISIECEDKGAKKVWEKLWLEDLDINECYEQIYWGTEKDGQSFPLEVWDSGELKGIAFIEPTSMWVGSHISHTSPATSLILPERFPIAKFKDLVHPLAYSSFVTDQNTQATNAQRVAIKQDCMEPVFAAKQKWQRYAIPHIARASRNIMHRQILEEYRRGTIEKYMSQMWLFTVGTKDFPATPNKVKNIRALINKAAKNRSNALVVDHLVDVKNISPATLDMLLGNETFAAIRQLIFADLGFSVFLIDGEVPGASGRGGAQVETDVQLHIERWAKHPRRLKKWAGKLSSKFAEKQKDEALAKYMPVFVVSSIGIQQMLTIKEKIMPLFSAGVLSPQTALKDSGYSYERELENKKVNKPNEELFQAPATFNQMTTGPDGSKSASSSEKGRPTLGRSPKQSRTKVEANFDLEASLEVYGALDEFERMLDGQFLHVIGGQMDLQAFVQWLEREVETRMSIAYQDGFADWGGRGVLDANIIEGAPQGVMFQLNSAQKMFDDLKTLEPHQLVAQRNRVRLYAGAMQYAYMLGVQQAMKGHGATGWTRVLHPELSISGPCAECQADSNVVHSMEEPFFQFHPGENCTTTSVQYTMARGPQQVRIPDFIRKIIRRV